MRKSDVSRPDIVVLHSLADVGRYSPDPMREPAFERFWGEAGTIGRIEFVKTYPILALVDRLRDEIADIRTRHSALTDPSPEWVPFLAAIDEYEALPWNDGER